MKRILLGLVLILGIFIGSMAWADASDMKFGAQGYIGGGGAAGGGQAIVAPATFVMDIGKDYEVNLGLGMRQNGKDVDMNTTIYLEGKWYMMKAGGVTFGPALGYLNGSFATVGSTKASDNNVNVFALGATAKKMIWENVALKLDVYALQLVSGKAGGSDIKDSSGYLPAVITSVVLYFF